MRRELRRVAFIKLKSRQFWGMPQGSIVTSILKHEVKQANIIHIAHETAPICCCNLPPASKSPQPNTLAVR